MSASVLIAVTEYKNSVVVPVEALNNTGSSYFVYTTFDEETKTLGGMVEVKIGIQNDSYAQVTEGLKEGDTIWYKAPEQNPFERYMNRANGNGSNRNNNRNRSGNNRPQGGYGGNNRQGGYTGTRSGGSGNGNRSSRKSSVI